MSKHRSRRNTKNTSVTQEQSAMEEVFNHDKSEHEGDAAGKMDQAETVRAGLASISNDIRTSNRDSVTS